jgi:hypothetical protein
VLIEQNYAFAMELSSDSPVPEWNGQVVRCPMEEPVVFAKDRCMPLNGRQIEFYLV